MEIDRGAWDYVIGQDSLSFADVELVCTAIDDAIAVALPGSAKTTIGVIDFILDHYKERLGEKLVILSDKTGYQIGGKK